MAEVNLRDVRKVYAGNVEAVKGITLDIPDGKLCVLVGPSGCGKSTLLRMVAGLESITSGEVSIGGRKVNDIEPADRDIAMVFQSYALYPHMSVYDNMAYGLRNRGTPKQEIDARVREAARILAIEPFLQRKPRQLSGGQRQRVAMGRAIVRKPQVFLFDEPLSNLDAKLRGQMRIEIKRLQETLGVTSVYVTHDQVEAMTLADVLVVMNEGRAEQIATPMEVYLRPASVFVAGFIGSPPMNMLAGTTSADGVKLDTGGTVAMRGLPAGQGGRAVRLGVRPEHMRTVADADADLRLEVMTVETLGADTLAHGRLAGTADTEGSIVARLPGTSAVKPGDVLPLRVDDGMGHLFDASTGLRV